MVPQPIRQLSVYLVCLVILVAFIPHAAAQQLSSDCAEPSVQVSTALNRVQVNFPTEFSSFQTNSNAFFNRALNAHVSGDYARAIDNYTVAISVVRQVIDTYRQRGNDALLNRDLVEAQSSLTTAVALSSRLAGAYANRAAAYLAFGAEANALNDARKAVDLGGNIVLNPAFAPLFYEQGNTLLADADYTAAVAMFSRALAIDPDTPAYQNRGFSYFNLGLLSQAEADYTCVLALDFQNAAAYQFRGRVRVAQGEAARAVIDFTFADAFSPMNPLIYADRGIAYREMERPENALKDFNRAIDIDPDNAVFYHNRGTVYQEMGQYGDAIVDYTSAIALEPLEAPSYYNRGWSYFRNGEPVRAIIDFSFVLNFDPNNVDAYNSRGLAYTRIADYQNAFLDFTRAIALAPDNADAYTNRGIVQYEQGNYQAAAIDYTEALALEPNNATARLNRGWAYRALGDMQRALRDFTFAGAASENEPGIPPLQMPEG